MRPPRQLVSRERRGVQPNGPSGWQRNRSSIATGRSAPDAPVFQPAQHVARADEDDDRLQARIAGSTRSRIRSSASEPTPDRAMLPTCTRDGAEPLGALRRSRASAEARPARRCPDRAGSLRAGSRRRRGPGTALDARHLVAALAVRVDVKPRDALQLREHIRVRTKPHPQPGRRTVVTLPPDPAARQKLGRGKDGQQGGNDQKRSDHSPSIRENAELPVWKEDSSSGLLVLMSIHGPRR